MTPLDTLEGANVCDRLADEMPDPMKRPLLNDMRRVWLILAAEGRKPESRIQEEFKEFSELEAAILRRRQLSCPSLQC